MSDSVDTPFRRVAVVGFGLMGGSLARALKALPEAPHIRALSADPRDRAQGMEAGVLDEAGGDPEALLADRDLVVYATPLRATLDLMEAHAPFLGGDAVVTDVVSLKAPVLRQAEQLGLGPAFVGSHPMVGGTGSGFGFSSDTLYRGAHVWLVPGPGAEARPLDRVRALWRSLGAETAEIEARRHDETMAWVSHLPQLTSNALAAALARAGISWKELGSGGRDMVRLAGSAPEMWQDLLEAAPALLPEALAEVERSLADYRRWLERGEMEGIVGEMEQTRTWVEKGR